MVGDNREPLSAMRARYSVISRTRSGSLRSTNSSIIIMSLAGPSKTLINIYQPLPQHDIKVNSLNIILGDILKEICRMSV